MRKGFTLLELLIVVIVVAILASFAVPQYLSAVERAKEGKARHNLSLIMKAEKMCRAANDSYVNINANDIDGTQCTGPNDTLGSYVEMEGIDADNDWRYRSFAWGNIIWLIANRQGGPNNGESLWLNQDGTWGGNFTP